jgi:hypothetical protein
MEAAIFLAYNPKETAMSSYFGYNVLQANKDCHGKPTIPEYRLTR